MTAGWISCVRITDFFFFLTQELAGALQSAHPKIQRMCDEESDDSEAVNKLLEINDSIHRTIERYKLMKKGDFDGATSIPKGTLGTKTGVSKNANNELSLIDFDPEPSSNGNAYETAAPAVSSLENDLLGLSFQDQGPAPTNSISLGLGRVAQSVSVHWKMANLLDS